jgi:hypothetical protein
LVALSFLQTQLTHMFKNKQKHKNSKSFGLWVGQNNTFKKNRGQ